MSPGIKLILFLSCLSYLSCLSACKKAEENPNGKASEALPIIDIAPQRAQLQKAKELEKKMQQDEQHQRQAIELQTNTP